MTYNKAQRAYVFAFKKEAQSFIEKLKQTKKTKLKSFTLYFGDHLEVPTVIILSGCGIEAARGATYELIQACPELSHIFNIGFAGAISEFYELEEVVQVGQVFNMAGDVLPSKLMLHNTLPIVKCISVERPVETSKEKQNIKNKYDVDLVDMEAAGFCSALTSFEGSVSIFKIISDFAEEDFKKEVINNSKKLSDKLEVKFKLAIKS